MAKLRDRFGEAPVDPLLITHITNLGKYAMSIRLELLLGFAILPLVGAPDTDICTCFCQTPCVPKPYTRVTTCNQSNLASQIEF